MLMMRWKESSPILKRSRADPPIEESALKVQADNFWLGMSNLSCTTCRFVQEAFGEEDKVEVAGSFETRKVRGRKPKGFVVGDLSTKVATEF
ncbi:hypothetical protein FNV43_RR17311 [Rhamnella rubrinervis]|uniref:Uncharacterized protein n=1 Tax=Rhamnella rubrinervis TaxID=2594499 RepID=A0A8K0E2C4_9ROSA|nr:hypothetical protein FNV43_RR17311 [Rhamnella rubrinervis]